MSQPDYVFTSAEDQLELIRLQPIEREFDPAVAVCITTGLTTGWLSGNGPGAGW